MRKSSLLSFVLVVVLLLSTFSSVFAVPNNHFLESRSIKRSQKDVTSIYADHNASGLDDRDEVRVIVQLEEDPIIEYATLKGVKINELDKNIRKQIKERLLARQKALKELIRSDGIKSKDLESFVNVINGFSILTTYGDAKMIEFIPGVSSVSIVNEYERPRPDMGTSKDIVNARETWSNLGYTGEGKVVAIIDTGIDPSHKDMILSDPDRAKLQEENMDMGSFLGTWRTIKVPYGYNYMDNNQEILDLGPEASEHGMHVAGTVGANGDEENDGIKGIAPEAQLLAMKVFGNNPALATTYGDIIVKAIDDSVALGADVINMSLGSTASFVQGDDLEQVAIKNAMENGVICAVSAGNSAQFGNGWDDPYTVNPDIGVVGSPGLATETIQVASIENTHQKAKSLIYTKDDVINKAPMAIAGGLNPISILPGPQEYVDGGSGHPSELTNVAGKVALIVRGGMTPNFTDKISNAQDAGAIGVIVSNHATGGDALVNMATPSPHTIPAVFIGYNDGLALIELENKIITFSNEVVTVPNPNSGKMSDFTSWGTTPNLDFKPEITAPGGSIWSTAQRNGYQSMSGTSMAAPHVAGGAALVLQRVDEEFGLEGESRVQMAKNLLLSTAVPLGDKGLYNNYYGLTSINFTSPRRQGAGVMDLNAATTTPAIVVDKRTGESKVALYEIDDMTTFTLRVENFGDKDITYRLKGTVQTDLTDGEYNFLETQGVYIDGTVSDEEPYNGEFPIYFDEEEITVEAGDYVDVEVTIDLEDAIDWFNNAPLNAIFPNGTFIEGFITLEDINDTYPNLNIPYMGFYGDWDQAPIIDSSNYDDEVPFYELTAMAWLDRNEGMYYFLGYDAEGYPDEDNIAFSPNGDGIADQTVPILSFLRNVKEMVINILDEDGNIVRVLAMEEYLRKNYHDGRDPIYTSKDFWEWDGTINNRLAQDGQYYYEIKVKVDYPGSRWQTLTFPVKIDTLAPVIEEILYDLESNKLEVIANDGDNEIYLYELYEGGRVVDQSLDGVFDLSEVKYSMKSNIVVHDFAGNNTVRSLEDIFKGVKPEKEIKPEKPKKPDKPGKPGKDNPPTPENPPKFVEPVDPVDGDDTIPTIMVNNPEFFEIYNSSQLTFEGYVEDESSLEYLRINNKDVTLRWNGNQGYWEFSFPMNFEDGLHSVYIEALDTAGNEIGFAHKIFIDTKNPIITLFEKIPTSTKDMTIILKGMIKDNLPSLKVRVNQNLITNISPDWSYFDELLPAEYALEYEVELVDGKNIIVIEAEDDAGNITRLEYKINKVKDSKK